jgi:amidase
MVVNLLTATATELQAKLTAEAVTSKQLVDLYLDQIARHNDYLKAVIATTPKDLLYQRASELDSERANGAVRGPLHGIPILLKVGPSQRSMRAILTALQDNIVSGPEFELPTTCGSLALVGSKPRKNVAVIDRVSHGFERR